VIGTRIAPPRSVRITGNVTFAINGAGGTLGAGADRAQRNNIIFGSFGGQRCRANPQSRQSVEGRGLARKATGC
jgi:hypothetical protein